VLEPFLPHHPRQVNRINTDILRLGAEKVKMLGKIKDFRKTINYIAWEHRYLSQMSRDLEEHYKDLQLTRVTRNLQDMLNVSIQCASVSQVVRPSWFTLPSLFRVLEGQPCGEGEAQVEARRGTLGYHEQGTRRSACQDAGRRRQVAGQDKAEGGREWEAGEHLGQDQ
jgi:hypothetical protein